MRENCGSHLRNGADESESEGSPDEESELEVVAHPASQREVEVQTPVQPHAENEKRGLQVEPDLTQLQRLAQKRTPTPLN